MSRTKRAVRPTPQLHARTTRSRGKAHESNPADTGKQLDAQLRALGLYAAPTLGDGNCLFRALADQLHGSPAGHAPLREQVCAWIARHEILYAPFCDDERGLDAHLRAMRQPATYGGHMELTAFAHMTGRDVKVVQPGLVYVIEASTFLGAPSPPPPLDPALADDGPSNSREARKLRRDRVKSDKARARVADEAAVLAAGDPADDEDAPSGPIYVAYHNWEHFSSIRNLVGPHAGLPFVHERPADAASSPPPSPARTKPPSSKLKPRTKPASKAVSKPEYAPEPEPEPAPASPPPASVPLPPSRSASPPPSRSGAPHLRPEPRGAFRSPKRTFDESSCSSLDAPSAPESTTKRARSHARRSPSRMALDASPDGDTADAGLSHADGGAHPDAEAADDFLLALPANDATLRGRPAASTPAPARSRSSSLSSAPSTPPPSTPASAPGTPLTKRARKRAGLPRTRAPGSAGKIRIPGGRMRVRAREPEPAPAPEKEREWVTNGAGRMDVRGFRELKI